MYFIEVSKYNVNMPEYIYVKKECRAQNKFGKENKITETIHYTNVQTRKIYDKCAISVYLSIGCNTDEEEENNYIHTYEFINPVTVSSPPTPLFVLTIIRLTYARELKILHQ